MTYSVKELFLTIQGEGAQTGRAAVFCRFSGCNLWTGREEDRATAVCQFCDTDFVGTDGDGGGKFDTASLMAAAINQDAIHGQLRKPCQNIKFCQNHRLLLEQRNEFTDVVEQGFP